MKIRLADADADAAEIAAIYAPFVRDTTVSFEATPPDEAEMSARIRRIGDRHCFLVADDGGALAGYAYATAHRERAAYRWSTEVSAYVADSARRAGVGRRLYAALLDVLRRQGFRMAYAGVTLPNSPSVAFHEAMGFRLVGRYENVGWKHGAWRDVGWWALDLAPSIADAPGETVTIADLLASGAAPAWLTEK